MGLRLIYGRAGTGKSEKCYKEISEKIKQNNKILIITPERILFKLGTVYNSAEESGRKRWASVLLKRKWCSIYGLLSEADAFTDSIC